MLLTLMDEPEKIPIAGRVVWITPPGPRATVRRVWVFSSRIRMPPPTPRLRITWWHTEFRKTDPHHVRAGISWVKKRSLTGTFTVTLEFPHRFLFDRLACPTAQQRRFGRGQR